MVPRLDAIRTSNGVGPFRDEALDEVLMVSSSRDDDAWDDADDIAAARVLPLDGDERSPRQRQPSNILADFRVLHVVGRGGFGKVPRTCAPSPRIVVPVRPGQGNAERVERALCR